MLRPITKNKRGSVADLFIFMIFAFVIIVFIGVFTYIGLKTEAQVKDSIEDIDFFNENDINATKIVDDTIGKFNYSMGAFKWLTILLIVGMIIAIWIASYLANTKAIFFISSIFIIIIAVVVATVLSNAYEQIIYADAELTPVFEGFVGANWIMLKLPLWISIVGFVSSIIMYSRLGKREEAQYGY